MDIASIFNKNWYTYIQQDFNINIYLNIPKAYHQQNILAAYLAHVGILLYIIEEKDSLLAAEFFSRKASILCCFPKATSQVLEPISVEGLFAWLYGRFCDDTLFTNIYYGLPLSKHQQIAAATDTACFFYNAAKNRLKSNYYSEKNLYLNDELLKDVEIPDGITKIGEQAFRGCRSLKSIYIPNSVIEIGECVCCGCATLECINIVGNNFVYKPIEGVLYDKKMTSIICLLKRDITSFVIPNSVTKICKGAFCNCVFLKSINIPNSVTKIGDLAFNKCSSLKSIDIPNSVTEIGERAFYELIVH